jgi:hypothetical protein
MSKPTFWDNREQFLVRCQALEFQHAKRSQTASVYPKFRRHRALDGLRDHVVATPDRRPAEEFYLPDMGLTLTEFALYDTMTRIESSKLSSSTKRPKCN